VYTLSVLDAGTRVLTGAPSLPASRVDDLPVVKSFARMEPARSTRFSTEFYDLYRESEQLFRTVRAYQREGRVEEAQALREGHREELGRRRALLGANNSILKFLILDKAVQDIG
jgi:hypothetical protein